MAQQAKESASTPLLTTTYLLKDLRGRVEGLIMVMDEYPDQDDEDRANINQLSICLETVEQLMELNDV